MFGLSKEAVCFTILQIATLSVYVNQTRQFPYFSRCGMSLKEIKRGIKQKSMDIE